MFVFIIIFASIRQTDSRLCDPASRLCMSGFAENFFLFSFPNLLLTTEPYAFYWVSRGAVWWGDHLDVRLQSVPDRAVGLLCPAQLIDSSVSMPLRRNWEPFHARVHQRCCTWGRHSDHVLLVSILGMDGSAECKIVSFSVQVNRYHASWIQSTNRRDIDHYWVWLSLSLKQKG